MCTHFCYKVVQCAIWNWCIVGFVQQVYCCTPITACGNDFWVLSLLCCWLSAFVARVDTFRPKQNGVYFVDDIFKLIFLNENVWISIPSSPKFVTEGPFNNIPALVEIIAWCRPGDKPLPGTIMLRLLTQICVTWEELPMVSLIDYLSPGCWSIIWQIYFNWVGLGVPYNG